LADVYARLGSAPRAGEGGRGGGGTPTHGILSTVARLPISVPPQLKSNSGGGDNTVLLVNI
jgi:hypothetical protein